jgi:hypothetical protein
MLSRISSSHQQQQLYGSEAHECPISSIDQVEEKEEEDPIPCPARHIQIDFTDRQRDP